MTGVVKLRYFARLKEALGMAGEAVEPPADVVDVAGLLRWLATRGPLWEEEFDGRRRVRAAINHELVAPDAAFKAGDEIALFPPVTGG